MTKPGARHSCVRLRHCSVGSTFSSRLPLEKIDKLALKQRLDSIGKS